MTPRSKTRRWWHCLVMILAIAALCGCRGSPESRMARPLDRGDKYFGKEQYHEAILEYLNALRIDPTNTHALRRAGLAHYELGEFGQSFQFLLRTQALDPTDTATR